MKLDGFLYNKELAMANNEKPLSKITIDGNEISGYFTYSFFNEKTYVKEPVRSSAGVIDNLNSYATFFTPHLKIHFNTLSPQMYRKIMNLINAKNEFLVQCYDPVSDQIVSHKMYFYPADFPELYTYDLEFLAVMNYDIELVGTNAEGEVEIFYYPNQNLPAYKVLKEFEYGKEPTVGYQIEVQSRANYHFANKWNTKQDGSGVSYDHGSRIRAVENISLYAQFEPNQQNQ